MAGWGPPPKPAYMRARRNRDAYGTRVIEVEHSPQPELPEAVKWPQRTREWWAMWGRSPLTADFTENDWNELLDTALLHAKFWSGDFKLAAELRLRVAKFGATPEDRVRLRIEFTIPDPLEAEVQAARRASSLERRGRLLEEVPNFKRRGVLYDDASELDD